MARSKRRFTNFFYILVTLCLVLVAKVQSSDDVNRVKRRMVAMCPPTFQKIRTECYHISPYPLTWLEAHFECKNKNGKLAEPTRIQDAAIRKFLLNKYASERDEIYFGGMYDNHNQEWSWGVSGRKFNYSSFIGLKSFKKRRTLDFTCTVYNPNRKFRWTPKDCTEQHRFMCEHKMPKVSDKNRDKVYQRWNITYPNQLANEVVMQVMDDDKHSKSGRVKVVSESGEEFTFKKRPHPHQPLLKRPTYNTPTPPTRHPNDVLSDGGNSVDNNEILKPTRNPKKDRTRSKFDREMAKLRRLERSRQRAAKKEERLRKQREREEMKKQRENDNQRKNLELQREKEERERKHLHDERIREQEERRRLEEATRREEEERQKLEDATRELERQQLENERFKRLEDQGKPSLVGADFVEEVITEDYKAIEQKKIEKQKEVERLEKEIQEKYQKEQEEELARQKMEQEKHIKELEEKEQEEELARQKMEQEKHIKELEEKELARRAEELKRREERERERQELIRRAEEEAKQIELEKKMEEQRRKDEEEYQKRLEKEKAEREEEERKEKLRQEQEQREREEEENRRRAEIQKEVDAKKDEEIEKEIRKKEKEEKKKEILKKLAKLSPEQREKFLELKRQKKLKGSKKLNEVTGDDKK